MSIELLQISENTPADWLHSLKSVLFISRNVRCYLKFIP